MPALISRLQALTDNIISYETSRVANFKRLKTLFPFCVLDDKFKSVEDLFSFKAMNLMGISLSETELGRVQKGRYIQLLVIASKEKAEKKSVNISLGYFGKSDLLDEEQVARLTEFVLRWRYEKSFVSLNHYKKLLSQIEDDHA